jgi:predicted RNase H-like HicB family nuclease
VPKYVVYLEPAEEGGYVIWCPALPGCVTQGETVEEALEMIKDAIQGYIESLKIVGELIPNGIEAEVERVEVVSI